ncbi:hypothetical protein TNIN_457561 [Trichonephila inaurata madagascariensis]|uniref:Uncharacterized protein n=1 Tax=Trichonephila inaurata madagascariensis TaxID=2747483 RepID=A0A8X6WYF6_9ARAC|nr:hypothetical protein TNIN_457561 [Trichonephila inaurata madagascariensis]
MDICYNSYTIAYFNFQPHGTSDIITKRNDTHNLLQPETIESVCIILLAVKHIGIWNGRYFKPLRNIPKCKMEAILPLEMAGESSHY